MSNVPGRLGSCTLLATLRGSIFTIVLIVAWFLASETSFAAGGSSRPQFEAAMRMVQARILARSDLGTAPIVWPDGPNGEISPLFPPDNYYGINISAARQFELKEAIRQSVSLIITGMYLDESSNPSGDRCNSTYSADALFSGTYYQKVFLNQASLSASELVNNTIADCNKLRLLNGGSSIWSKEVTETGFIHVFKTLIDNNTGMFSSALCDEAKQQFTDLILSNTVYNQNNNTGGSIVFSSYEQVRRKVFGYSCPVPNTIEHNLDFYSARAAIDLRFRKAMKADVYARTLGAAVTSFDEEVHPPDVPGLATAPFQECLDGGGNVLGFQSFGRVASVTSGGVRLLPRVGPADPTSVVHSVGTCSFPAIDCAMFSGNVFAHYFPTYESLADVDIMYTIVPDFYLRERPSPCHSCGDSCSKNRLSAQLENADELLVVNLGNRIDGTGGSRFVHNLYPSLRQSDTVIKWDTDPIFQRSASLAFPPPYAAPVALISSSSTRILRTRLPDGSGIVDASHELGSSTWTYKYYTNDQISMPAADPAGWTVPASAVPRSSVSVALGADGSCSINEYDENETLVNRIEGEGNGSGYTRRRGVAAGSSGAASVITESIATDGIGTIKTTTTSDGFTVSSKTIERSETVAGALRVTQRDICVTGDANPSINDDRLLRTKWEYYATSAEPGAFVGRVKVEHRSDGGWTRWYYDGSGAVIEKITGFLDNDYSESDLSQLEAQNVVTKYETLPVASLSRGLAPAWWGIPGSAAQVPVTNVVRVTTFYPRDNSGVTVSEPVSCSYEFEIVDSAQNPSVRSTKWSIRCAEPSQPIASDTTAIATFLGQCLRGVIGSVDTGVPFNGANLVSVTELSLDGNGNWFTSKELGSEGTLTLTQVTGTTTKVWQGYPITSTSTPTAFLADFLHHTLSVETHDTIGLGTSVQYDSGPNGTMSATTDDILVQSRVESNPDVLRRPQRVDYLDGTYETKTYACCGIASETDRDGAITFYTYDALGRVASSSKKLPQGTDLITTYDYDAEGRVIRTRRSSSVAAEPTVTLEETEYDLAGRVKATTQRRRRPTDDDADYPRQRSGRDGVGGTS